MFELRGKINTALVTTDDVEDVAVGQIISLLNEPIIKDTKIVIMPDVNLSKGTVTGTAIKSNTGKLERIAPSLIGPDICCGVLIRKIKVKKLKKKDLKKLDYYIETSIPSGFEINKYENTYVRNLLKDVSIKLDEQDLGRIKRSLGTLGGGNHFIELGKTSDDYWLAVHTGSRTFGNALYKEHQKIAYDNYRNSDTKLKIFSYLTDSKLDNYKQDMLLAEKFSVKNRQTILDKICSYMKWETEDEFDSIHNFIDFDRGILRKGSTSAFEGERQVLPLNMKDGFLIVEGLGNEDWVYSAPHGSGRKLSRSKAKDKLNFESYEKDMKEVYSSSVGKNTLDEAPRAYKNSTKVIEQSKGTIKPISKVKSIYNFKAH